MWQRFCRTQGSFRRRFRPVLTLIRDSGLVLTARSHAHPLKQAMSPAWQGPGWAMAGALALLCSTVAWASFPRMVEVPVDGQRQWVALGVTSLSGGGATGMPMAPTDAVQTVDFVPKRAVQPQVAAIAAKPAAPAAQPMRIRGRVGDGLYWSLRA